MKSIPLFLMIFRPSIVREVAAERSEIAAIVVNAVNGVLMVTAAAMTMLPLFKGSLVALLGILFGPLAAFLVSSLYSRIEWTVGRRLQGKASLDDIYRISAWSSVPMGFACMLYSLLLLPLKNSGPATLLVASIPSLAIAFCAVRNYLCNFLFVQQFTRVRGVVSILLTLVFFIIVMAGGMALFSLFIRYVASEGLKTTFWLSMFRL